MTIQTLRTPSFNEGACLERQQTILCHNGTQSRATVTESGFSHFKTGVYNITLSRLFPFTYVLIHSFLHLINSSSSMNSGYLRSQQRQICMIQPELSPVWLLLAQGFLQEKAEIGFHLRNIPKPEGDPAKQEEDRLTAPSIRLRVKFLAKGKPISSVQRKTYSERGPDTHSTGSVVNIGSPEH